jgi:hypothetical protein
MLHAVPNIEIPVSVFCVLYQKLDKTDTDIVSTADGQEFRTVNRIQHVATHHPTTDHAHD